MNWLTDEEREGGPRGFIGFAISARMSETGAEGQCAEVPFVPGEKTEKKNI
ncbi:MAG TPA: hypothetical protein VG028_16110 [Terriglobia bacterium]|nr:hypothetical protein [Terriglobia bacterium]